MVKMNQLLQTNPLLDFYCTPTYIFIIVSSEDNLLLVKGGIGIYTALLTEAIQQVHPHYTVRWVTESPRKNELMVKEIDCVVHHYLSCPNFGSCYNAGHQQSPWARANSNCEDEQLPRARLI
jgi:hypothetical protein